MKVKINTKKRIVDTARDLFNKQTASAVSTNHIAAAMDISPGNIYYYFHNKEEIIAEIFSELFERMDAIFHDPVLAESEEGIADYFYKLSQLLYEYRFCYLELTILLSNDSILKAEYAYRTHRIFERLTYLYDGYVERGMAKPLASSEEKAVLVKNIWLVGSLWITYVDILYNSVTSQNINEVFWHVYGILKPYFYSHSRKKIEKLLKVSLKKHP